MGLCARLKARMHRSSCCESCESGCGGGESCDSCGSGSATSFGAPISSGHGAPISSGHGAPIISGGSGYAAPHIGGTSGAISPMPLSTGTIGTPAMPITPGTMPPAGEQIKAPRNAGTGDKMPSGTREDKGKENNGKKDDNKEARTEPLPEVTPATPVASPVPPASRAVETDIKNSPF